MTAPTGARRSAKSPLAFRTKFAVSKQGEAVSEFRVIYQKKSYCPCYTWDAQLNKYKRFYNNKPYVDGETGENKCEYFIGGKHFTGAWKREGLHKNTVYYDSNGKVVKLNPGKTFIQVLRTERQVEILA